MQDYAGRLRQSSMAAAVILSSIFMATCPPGAQAQTPGYRLPEVDLHQKIIWGATCEGPDGIGLRFGGEDQSSDDGCGHTQIRKDGKWIAIYDRLRDANALQREYVEFANVAANLRSAGATSRRYFFDADSAAREIYAADTVQGRTRGGGITNARVQRFLQHQSEAVENEMSLKVRISADHLRDKQAEIATIDRERCRVAEKAARQIVADLNGFSLSYPNVAPAVIEQISAAQVAVEKVAEGLDCEPPPRALSPIVYEPKSKRFILFGGDHCDYLTNDTWTFDPTDNTWKRMNPPSAPPPRANHKLTVLADGTIQLSGGYNYTSTTDYMGGQYRDLNDGKWIYDPVKDTWTGGKGVTPNDRVYRTGPFLPNYFVQGPRPDAGAFGDWLAKLPANTWKYTEPPQLPKLNRDRGSAVLDPDHDLILRFSGGHCAHGGTDVLQFHLATNRWELPFPVEFPLGQLYSNTSYPEGFNFNHRPWITGHTYQSYGYDTNLKNMLFIGQTYDTFYWNPQIADWIGRTIKPHGMTYDSCFYSLTTCSTPRGLVCWTKDGAVFRFDAAYHDWTRFDTHGETLPGSVVDNSTVAYDSRRDRLLLVRREYGDGHSFNGELHALDLKTGAVTKLTPAGSAAAAKIPYLCQLRYDAEHDLLLVGATLPPDASGFRRTPAYDCAGDRWVSLRIGGDDPSGKVGRNVSLGLMNDGKRKLFWAVDTNSNVYVLRLDPVAADLQPL